MNNKQKKETECSCHNIENLVIDRKSLSRYTSLLLLGLFFVFSLGYFWGKREAIQDFSTQVTKEAFADHISTSIDSLCSNNVIIESSGEDKQSNSKMSDNFNQVTPKQELPSNAEESHKSYFAELIGFGYKKYADQFISRQANKGIILKLKTRTSISPKGKKRTWYQVVTPQYSDQNELKRIVKTLKDIEKLHDVRIVAT